jgi:F-type H+/Na+-transporting ATPase subunit alpha
MTNSSNIINSFEEAVKGFDPNLDNPDIGLIASVKDGIANIVGLQGCMAQEMLYASSGIKLLALNLEEEKVGAIILGRFEGIKEGDLVVRSKQVMSVPVDEKLLGRVINPVGEAIDGKPLDKIETYRDLENPAPGVLARQPVKQPLQTGIKAIDALIPIGRGQRELILGDRQTGKTTIAIDTIINQADQDVICIYVAIGQRDSKVARTVSQLKESGAMDYTIVVSAGASDPAPMVYLAPYTGVSIAEYFADKGKDVLIVYDDLTKHAVGYRELSLLLRRPPGREAYPGDVFYLHSRLLERACKLSDEKGGGSITALPIIETQAGDLSAYIPTNVISITDGQVFLESDLFYRGMRPAINIGSSVSRVGSAAQIKPMKKVAGSMKLELAQFRELEAFSQFSSDLDPETKKVIQKGQKLTELLKQNQFSPIPVEEQVLSIFATNKEVYDHFDIKEIKDIERDLIRFAKNEYPKTLETIKNGEWGDEIEAELSELCKRFLESVLPELKEDTSKEKK